MQKGKYIQYGDKKYLRGGGGKGFKGTVRNKQDFQTSEDLAWACSQNVTLQKPRAVAKRCKWSSPEEIHLRKMS